MHATSPMKLSGRNACNGFRIEVASFAVLIPARWSTDSHRWLQPESGDAAARPQRHPAGLSRPCKVASECDFGPFERGISGLCKDIGLRLPPRVGDFGYTADFVTSSIVTNSILLPRAASTTVL